MNWDNFSSPALIYLPAHSVTLTSGKFLATGEECTQGS